MLLPCQDVVLSLQRLSCSTRAVLVSLSLSLSYLDSGANDWARASCCTSGLFFGRLWVSVHFIVMAISHGPSITGAFIAPKRKSRFLARKKARNKLRETLNELHFLHLFAFFLPITITTMAVPSNDAAASLALLEKAQAMIRLEQSLTATMEKVEPWLPSRSNKGGGAQQANRPRVRPLPTTLEQVDSVLAVARNWAARTSAPAGWNPAAPVMGFTTPAPMPHQLRGGALAGMQLERARQAERDKKRQRVEQEQQQEQEAAAAAAEEKDSSKGTPMEVDEKMALDPKKKEVSELDKELQRTRSDLNRQDTAARDARSAQLQRAKSQDVSMNLSDSSSSDDDDDDD